MKLTSDGRYLQEVSIVENNVDPNLDTSVAISGVITVTTAGTAVQGSDIATPNGVFVKAAGANTGKGYVGNDGEDDVAATTGFELAASELILIQVSNLNELWFDTAVNGEKFCWIKA